MATRRRRELRARERVRGHRMGRRGLTGSEFGAARPPAKTNQIAGRGAPLCGESAGLLSGPPRPRK